MNGKPNPLNPDIKGRMKELNITAADLAEELRYTKSYIYNTLNKPITPYRRLLINKAIERILSKRSA